MANGAMPGGSDDMASCYIVTFALCAMRLKWALASADNEKMRITEVFHVDLVGELLAHGWDIAEPDGIWEASCPACGARVRAVGSALLHATALAHVAAHSTER